MPTDDFYPTNSAINEYQAQLAAQQAADQLATQHTPGNMVALYALKERVPNWNMLLNIGAGKGGLGVYSSADLGLALEVLNEEIVDPYWHKPGDYHFKLGEQFSRILDELEYRAS